MTAYRLFNEWRGRRVIGENLADALLRNGLIEADKFGPDEVAYGNKMIAARHRGEAVKIKKTIIAERAGNRRGDYKPEVSRQAVLELEDCRIVEVDAVIEEENIG